MMIGSSAAQMSSVMSVAGVAQEGVVSGEDALAAALKDEFGIVEG